MFKIANLPRVNNRAAQKRITFRQVRIALFLSVVIHALGFLALPFLFKSCDKKTIPKKPKEIIVNIELTPPKIKPKKKMMAERPTNKEIKTIKDKKNVATGTSDKKSVGRPKRPRIRRKKIRQRIVAKKEVESKVKPSPKPFPKSDVPLDAVSFNLPTGGQEKLLSYEQEHYNKLIAENRNLQGKIKREGGYALYLALRPLGEPTASQRGNDNLYNGGGCRGGCMRLYSPKVEKEVKKNETLKKVLTDLKRYKKINLTPDKKRRIISRLIRLLRCSICKRSVAAEALAGFGKDARPAIPALRAILKDPDPKLRDAAKRALQIIEASK